MAYASTLRRRPAVVKHTAPPKISHTPGTFAPYSFWGPESAQQIDCQVFFPATYNGTTRVPVVYLMHGSASDDDSVAGALASRIVQANTDGMRACIFAIFNAGPQSYYLDNVSGSNKAAKKFRDFRRWIEASTMTHALAAWRYLLGFSMGGFGAANEAGDNAHEYAGVQLWGPPKLYWHLPPNGAAWTPDLVADLAPEPNDTPYHKWARSADAIIAAGSNWCRVVFGTADGGKAAGDAWRAQIAALGITLKNADTTSQHVITQYPDHDRAQNVDDDWTDHVHARLAGAV